MTTETQNDSQLQKDILLLQRERPLFEANYSQNGGDLRFIKWDACSDGTGNYQPDWKNIDSIDHDDDFAKHEFQENTMQHAGHVFSCLMAWVECAKSKEIPEGWVLAPLEPNEKQKRTAMFSLAQDFNMIECYRAMLADLVDQEEK